MKSILLAISILVSILAAKAQNVYYTGWDNAAENAGWTQIQKGDIGLYQWDKDASTSVSPDSCLAHYYPVGGTVPTDNWFISPVFDFSAGGWIDTLWHNFSGFGTPMTGDSIVLYLLNGSADPDLATKTVLYNFSDSTYTPDNTWYEHLMIPVGTHPGNSYLALKYYTTNNWLDVKFDNLFVTSLSTASIGENIKNEQIKVHPNPATNLVHIDIPTDLYNEMISISIYDNCGSLVQEIEVDQKSIDVSQLEAGLYFIKLLSDEQEITKQLIIQN
ncbi:Por secretion system C-terminal sorting domain-containing protein [Lishizhenia tianjinensis]|uniref:Por secretion system C-terminal sorting domain-containing protein n=1 Tax=Lishizhenia tianjinensis TaxID=477690 RepID=A0A1I6XSX6_9FLAO|nr:T9SS type A sorting domain-containing protein [Lishizhenia tianjinensis]SFT41569.1 Por secretion system C-terminal sorting domain-containing protein [Lishizhenia tianjinensis]